MPHNDWPPLSVRNWRAVLEMRSPDFGGSEEDQDGINAAEESRRLHELRGVIIGQVAEVENLLLHIGSQIRKRVLTENLPQRPKQMGAGNALNDVEALLGQIGLRQEHAADVQRIRQVIHQRNEIVHAVIHIGYAYIPFNDSRESVVVFLVDNDERRQRKRANAEEPAAESDELGECYLEGLLTDAYNALDRCIDIWQRVDGCLPQRNMVHDDD